MNPVLHNQISVSELEQHLQDNYFKDPVVKAFVDARWNVWKITDAFSKAHPTVEEYYRDTEDRRTFVAQVEEALAPLMEAVDHQVRNRPQIEKPPELKIGLAEEDTRTIQDPSQMSPHFLQVSGRMDPSDGESSFPEKPSKLKRPRKKEEDPIKLDRRQKTSRFEQILTKSDHVFHCEGRPISNELLAGLEKVSVAADFMGNIYAFSLSEEQLKAQLHTWGWANLKIETWPRYPQH